MLNRGLPHALHLARRDEIARLEATINGMLQALEDAYRQVQELNDLERQFLADVSHELRTPLTIMLSSLDLLGTVGAADPEFQGRALADMRVEAERMARMVSQLLLLARTDAGAALNGEPLLLVDVLAEVCRQTRPPEDGATFTCEDLSCLEGAVVRGSADYLKQIFLILLDKAFKYTPAPGNVRFAAELRQGSVAVRVSDTGTGIPAADLPRIFDRFYRAGNARGRGLGLGLAIARRLVEQHGGRIEVESAVGRASRFTVMLPLLNAASCRCSGRRWWAGTVTPAGLASGSPPGAVAQAAFLPRSATVAPYPHRALRVRYPAGPAVCGSRGRLQWPRGAIAGGYCR
jgi:signal transduction histidine kinase